MQHKKKILEELRRKDLIYDGDGQSLASKLLEKEISEGRRKDSVIKKLMDIMKKKGMMLIPCLSIILRTF